MLNVYLQKQNLNLDEETWKLSKRIFYIKKWLISRVVIIIIIVDDKLNNNNGSLKYY